MRKIIIPTGYMGSGSSAITDLVSEFENVNNSHKDFEYIFLHCPNGLFDLEDKLLIGNNSIRSDEALHSFLETMKDLYDKKFWWPGYYKNTVGNEFYTEVLRFVNSLVDIESKNYWYYQEKPNKIMQFKYFFKVIIEKLTSGKIKIKKPLLYDKILLSYKTPDEFYSESRKFINNVLDIIDSNKQDILLDQLLLPHNIFRINNYFDDNLRVIVVERDPRDVFILNKYAWAKKEIDVPYSFDVKKFCKQYKSIRNLEKKYKNKNVLRIRFEDLVYDYENSEKKICKFLGYSLEQHVNKFNRFNPEVSIRNTQVFASEKEYEKEVKIIEKELNEYLYKFPRKVESKVENTIG